MLLPTNFSTTIPAHIVYISIVHRTKQHYALHATKAKRRAENKISQINTQYIHDNYQLLKCNQNICQL